MYLMRLFLKSFFLFFLVSCESEIPAQENQMNQQKENVAVKLEKPIVVGAEQLDSIQLFLQSKKVGVVGNQTSRVGETHLVDTLLSSGINVVKVYSPEHGFRGKADAGEHVASDKDAKTGLPIVSLYGSNKKPSANQLSGVEVLLFDLQDVGARFYTYISTLHYIMEAAAENGIEVLVLDRPNPNGHYVDGPIRKKGYESFVGMHPIPIVHGMTVGEIAQMINGEKWLKNGVQCKLKVISCLNYDRHMPYSLPVAPSPNLRSDEAIQLYPGLCLFEGTSLSVGRGTDRPFEVYGHPDLKGKPGFDYNFTPVSSFGSKNPKHKDQVCYGENLHDYVRNSKVNKLEIQWLIKAYNALGSEDFFITKNRWFDILAGTDQLRKDIISGKSEAEIRAGWKAGLDVFKTMRKEYLIYGGGNLK
ncbi:exo-beta-N-acetylmuramidase NamZ family protein [Brumimicrobium aurantiacum]|uniref:DUF1343 domain-containing protein n=1 Tax=Brumimicrobium aurantiacum TaxID=1737063 RepID=A0A3E1EZ94_9FLAO|nr:DUF1343 domain-containing protein [Brumimicrobium aurantiacum]RFC54777.1 DUF1343 domain-containing protein [Brumimicrobium aurantiacum]